MVLGIGVGGFCYIYKDTPAKVSVVKRV